MGGDLPRVSPRGWVTAGLAHKEPQAGNKDRFAGLQVLGCKGETACRRPHGDDGAIGMIGQQPARTRRQIKTWTEPHLLRIVRHVKDFRLNALAAPARVFRAPGLLASDEAAAC